MMFLILEEKGFDLFKRVYIKPLLRESMEKNCRKLAQGVTLSIRICLRCFLVDCSPC